MEENKVNETLENKVVEESVKNEEVSGENKAPRKGNGKKFDRRNNKNDRKEPVQKEFEERVVSINRVSKTVKGGRRMKFAALVVVGNGKGKYGFGTGKSGEVPDAIKKACEQARKNTSSVQLTKGATISHEVVGEFGATKVFLKPAKEGTGIIAGGPVRAILELAGVKNVYSKVYGSRTSINIIRATNIALNSLKDYKTVLSLRKGGNEDVK